MPACDPFPSPPLSLCFSRQPLNLRTPSLANHSHRKALCSQSHSGGSRTSQCRLATWTAKWPHLFQEDLNELSCIPHCRSRAHSPNFAHPLLLIATPTLTLAVNNSAWIPKMYGLWWEGRPFRTYFMCFGCQEKNGLLDLVYYFCVDEAGLWISR